MAWNDQTFPVPSDGGRPDSGALSSRPDNAGGPAVMPGPVQAQVAAPPFSAPPTMNPLNPSNPAMTGPSAVNPAPGQFTGQAPSPAIAGQAMPVRAAGDQDQTDAHDDIWIERSKRAIAETQNDPFRQVQLLQHLNKLYLKERFGREVQADKG